MPGGVIAAGPGAGHARQRECGYAASSVSRLGKIAGPYLVACVTMAAAAATAAAQGADQAGAPVAGQAAHSAVVPAGNPGLRESDGREHQRHTPHVASQVIDVVKRAASLGYTIDLTDSDHDDRPAIEAVLADARTAYGSTVYFPDGTYNLLTGSEVQPNANLVLVKSGVNLQGQSRERTILRSGFDDRGRTSLSGIFLRGVHDVVISNLTVTSNWARQYSTDSSANNADAGGLTYAIAMGYGAGEPVYNVTIDNVLVEKFRRMGVRIGAGSHDVVVKHSLARNATDVGGGGAGYGFSIQGDGHRGAAANPYLGRPDKDTYFVVLDNNQTDGPYIRHAVIVQYWAHHNLVTRSRFEGTQLDAIDLHGEDEYSNEVSYNTVVASERAGVGLGNSGATHDKTGVDNWIHHNDLVACAWGITVQFGTADSTIEDNTVRDNTSRARAPFAGILLGKSANTVVRNNVFRDNTVAGFSAIVLKDDRAMGEEAAGGPRNARISGNRVINSGAALSDLSNRASENAIQSSW